MGLLNQTAFCLLCSSCFLSLCLFTFFFGLGFLSNRWQEAGSGGAQLAKATLLAQGQSPGPGGGCGCPKSGPGCSH